MCWTTLQIHTEPKEIQRHCTQIHAIPKELWVLFRLSSIRRPLAWHHIGHSSDPPWDMGKYFFLVACGGHTAMTLAGREMLYVYILHDLARPTECYVGLFPKGTYPLKNSLEPPPWPKGLPYPKRSVGSGTVKLSPDRPTSPTDMTLKSCRVATSQLSRGLGLGFSAPPPRRQRQSTMGRFRPPVPAPPLQPIVHLGRSAHLQRFMWAMRKLQTADPCFPKYIFLRVFWILCR
jgi:hypothetical protein